MDSEGVITVLDNEYASVWYHSKEKIIHHQFKKFIFGEPFRQVLRTHLELMERYGGCKILSDDRGNGPLTPEDAEWAVSTYRPQIVAMGKKYWGVVMPELVLGKMNMRRWIKVYADMGVTAEVFSDPDEAFQWLAAQ